MDKEKPPFRFLDNGDFQVLTTKEKAVYLVLAQQMLEERRRILSQQVEELTRLQRQGR